ncbi:hypothetical protein DFQ27_002257 [Actinomortierella ambigua]|uniref:F-box domain-containing protein n=1 Tax=Actinomortierella ambigua TaxID=1343610 RepID=A0A9P6U7L3_9FUNG|nr:hypothetical protein DFQ27_002257 [Actinomortierella ambigua]
MALPTECIQVIFDNLDPATLAKDRTVFLRVSRAFLEAGAKRLYSDPIETIRACSKGSGSSSSIGSPPLRAARAFLSLVLRYSPAQDPDIQSLRYALRTALNSLPATPTIDYLSLVMTIPYDAALYGPSAAPTFSNSMRLGKVLSHSCMGLHDALTWAAFGHRLSKVRNIEIPWGDLPRYFPHIDCLTSPSIRSIRLTTLNSWSEACAAKYDALTDDDYSRKLYAPIDVQIASGTKECEWWMSAPFISELQRIYRHLPVSTPHEIHNRSGLEWARFALAPESIDLSHVHAIEQNVQTYRHGAQLCSWPEQGRACILQQCRSLQRLAMGYGQDDGADLFAWAAQERRDAEAFRVFGDNNNNNTIHSLIPLTHLELTRTGLERHPTQLYPNVPDHLWKPLQDAVFAFRATLQKIVFHDPYSTTLVDLCMFHDMPALSHLDITAHTLHSTHVSGQPLFSGCSALTTLHLTSEMCLSLSERWHLPRVKALTLLGGIVFQFDQTTLQTAMQHRIETLVLSDYVPWLPRHNINANFSWDMACWTTLRFARLKTLHLTGITAYNFCWSMLAQCPHLEDLLLSPQSINAPGLSLLDPQLSDAGPWTSLLSSSSSTSTSLSSSSSTLPGSSSSPTGHPTIKKLYVHSVRIPYRSLVNRLPCLFPNLETLTILNCLNIEKHQKNDLYIKFPLLKELKCGQNFQ